MNIVPPNCLSKALDRWHTAGGYIAFRKSSVRSTPHAMHIGPDGLRHYVPKAPLPYSWSALLGFDGDLLEEETSPAPPVPLRGVLIGVWILAIGGTVWVVDRLVRRAWRKLCR